MDSEKRISVRDTYSHRFLRVTENATALRYELLFLRCSAGFYDPDGASPRRDKSPSHLRSLS